MVNVEWKDFFNQSIEIKKDVKRENAISNLKQINDKCRGSQQGLLVVRGPHNPLNRNIIKQTLNNRLEYYRIL